MIIFTDNCFNFFLITLTFLLETLKRLLCYRYNTYTTLLCCDYRTNISLNIICLPAIHTFNSIFMQLFCFSDWPLKSCVGNHLLIFEVFFKAAHQWQAQHHHWKGDRFSKVALFLVGIWLFTIWKCSLLFKLKKRINFSNDNYRDPSFFLHSRLQNSM